MLDRKVLIDGTVYDHHELVMVTLQPDSLAIATVRSSMDDDTTMTETAYEVALDGAISFSTWEQEVWKLPAFEEWQDTAAGLEEVLDILTDEQAETVTTLFPKWKVGVDYILGNRVQDEAKLYKCVQAHTSQEGWEPHSTPALWTKVAKDGEIPDWVQPTGAQDAYNTGDRVRYEGKVYESTVDGNVWSPADYPQGWKLVD